LSMPDREHVPDYTVVRFVNSQIDLQRLEGLVKNCSPGQSHWELSDSCKSTIAKLAHHFAGKHERGLDQVLAVTDELRNRFKLAGIQLSSIESDGEESTPIEQFLENRAGPNYMFATAGALMLEHLGYQTRLVTGFYANPMHYLSGENEIAVLPRDAHVWLEINAGHGYWIPLEPTPGFDKPRYSASFWYRLNKAKAAIAVGCAIGLAFTVVTFLLRRMFFEIACRFAWPFISLIDDRRQVAFLTRVLDQRLRLAGSPRQPGTTQRMFFLNPIRTLPQDQANQMHRFFNDSDQLCFGVAQHVSAEGRTAIRYLWNALTVYSIRRNNRRLIRTDH
jgi:protein-glutamine gamma-glutamyltransferase